MDFDRPGVVRVLSFISELQSFVVILSSFVRSVTMDKWKDLELEKMKAGGNNRARQFMKSQPDYDPSWNLQEKYNSKAAALYRDKVKYMFVCLFE